MKNIFLKIYRNQNVHTGALILRLALGILFITTGWMKVSNIDMTIGYFNQMGFSSFEAYLVGYTELIAGILVLVGFLIKPSSVALGVVMAVVVFGLPPQDYNIYFGHNYEFMVLVMLIALYFIGPGKYSIAGWRQSKKIQQA